MLHSIQNLIGFTMGATDGEIGKVKDFYFDDKTWKIRYLVVETGNWLFGRKVLLSPVALQSPDWNSKVFPVNLTRDQIKHSPDIDTEKPVSHQQEADLHSHYSWPNNEQGGVGFMTTGMVGGVVAPDVPFEERIAEEFRHHENDTISDRGPEWDHRQSDNSTSGGSNLRSFKDLSGYSIHGTDGEFGEVDDLLIDSNSWSIPFLVIETGNWYAGKKVLIATNTINGIHSENSSVQIQHTTSSLRDCPEFDYNEPINQEMERNLYNYHQTGPRS